MIPHNHAEHRALSLTEVSANFEQWRATRTKKSKIPDELWQQAIPLLKKYAKSKICHALKLNGGQFNAKVKLYQSAATQITPAADMESCALEGRLRGRVPSVKLCNKASIL